MLTQLQLTGIALRPPHMDYFLQQKPKVAWVEVHSENYFGEGGSSFQQLHQIRKDYPLSFHGVNLSIGSADDLNWQYLKNLKQLFERFEPCLVSDHLAFTSVNGQYFHELLPIPYTSETLDHVVMRLQEVQEYLQRKILIENISAYVAYDFSTYSEWDFLSEVANRSGCGILLDVNNLYVNSVNLHFSTEKYLEGLSLNHIEQLHLGGFSVEKINDRDVLVDTHSKPIVPAVWDLYKEVIQKFGPTPTMIEWDTDLPTLETLYLEAYRAEKLLRETYATTKRSA